MVAAAAASSELGVDKGLGVMSNLGSNYIEFRPGYLECYILIIKSHHCVSMTINGLMILLYFTVVCWSLVRESSIFESRISGLF